MTRDEIWSRCVRAHYSASLAAYWMDHPVCEACRRSESSCPHHLRSRGAGGDDDPVNLLALCTACHTGPHGYHVLGRSAFCKRWPHLRRKVDAAFERARGQTVDMKIHGRYL